MPAANTQQQYYEGIGRRKESTARVRLYPTKEKETTFLINDTYALEEYFETTRLQSVAKQALATITPSEPFLVSVHLSGGGISGQAEAMRHGIARALLAYDEQQRRHLKQAGLLKRDPREKERRKFGKKKARKSPQWSKR